MTPFNRQGGITRIHIFDVEHGECGVIETPLERLIMIGAGHNSSTGWRPSEWLQGHNQRPDCLVLSNLDRDHLSDLPSFERLHIPPYTLMYNEDISPEWVRKLKIKESGEVHLSVETALYWIEEVFTGRLVNIDYGIEVKFFFHPQTKFQDTNNLSVVTFISYYGVGVMFPGDLECAGWEEFLNNQEFLNCLRMTNILLASHHGREGGYCPAVFNYCNPDVVIISDKPIEHKTQDHNLYAQHCKGKSHAGVQRKVLTTRNDGKITIDIQPTGNYAILTNQNYY